MSERETEAVADGAGTETPARGRARTAGRPRVAAMSNQQITAAVTDLITERGLQGWSLRDLANRLGVSTGTITYYFRDKQTLLVDVLDSTYALPGDVERFRAEPPAEQLRQMAAFFVLDSERRRRGWRFFVEYMAGAGHDPILRERHDGRYERQRRFYARLIEAGIQSGDLQAELNAQREAERLIALGNGLVLQQLVTPDLLSADVAREILTAHLNSLLRTVDKAATET